MNRAILSVIGTCLLIWSSGRVSAEVVFDWAIVGNPGNSSDRLYTQENPDNLQFGTVNYPYRISKREVTNDQYVEFLNKVARSDPSFLYTGGGMQIRRTGNIGSFTYAPLPGFAPQPVRSVSIVNAMRFVNWLENGQPTGAQGPETTEAGVYTIGSGISETRAPWTTYVIPSEDEWYKAAYHDPRSEAEGGPPGDDNYWLYPTQSDTAPTAELPPGGTNSANFDKVVGDATGVGAYSGTTSFYGAFDLGGNLDEWNEAVIHSSFRGFRGGGFDQRLVHLEASYRNRLHLGVYPGVGFRVAKILSGDFNLDDVLTVADIDALTAAVRDSSTDPSFDLDGDGIATDDDRRIWVERLFGTLQGDASLDKNVDFFDFTSLSFFFGQRGGWAQGDFDGNGLVQFPDFLILSANFGKSTAATAAVPEPSTLALAVLGFLCLPAWRRTRRF